MKRAVHKTANFTFLLLIGITLHCTLIMPRHLDHGFVPDYTSALISTGKCWNDDKPHPAANTVIATKKGEDVADIYPAHDALEQLFGNGTKVFSIIYAFCSDK